MTTAALCTLTELKHLVTGTPAADDTLLQELLDAVEDHFVRECGRTLRPFSAAITGRVEWRDGTGDCELYLDYPVGTLTEILIGRDATDPDETLDFTDVDVLVYTAGRRRLVRTDSGSFGARNQPKIVRVTYTTAADLPTDCALAVKRVTAAIYRQKGSEDVTHESIEGYSRDLKTIAADDPIWGAAVGHQLSLA